MIQLVRPFRVICKHVSSIADRAGNIVINRSTIYPVLLVQTWADGQTRFAIRGESRKLHWVDAADCEIVMEKG